MYKFTKIAENINSDLENFEILLHKISDSQYDVVQNIIKYIFETKGKRIRPTLVYLVARLFDKPTESTDTAALLVEIIHTATLLHDDVIDRATLRRDKPTVNSLWNDKTAVLTGDYLFATAMKLATDKEEYKLFNIITPAVINLSIGELLQIDYSKDFLISKEKYYQIISYKTASLISVCCEAGAYTVNAKNEDIIFCRNFGELLGCIFQIKDDILDYVGDKNTGKEIGIDIKEKKVTLPLISAWNNMSETERNRLLFLWSSIDNNSNNIQEIINIVIKNNGISICEGEMFKLKKEAINILDNFNDSKAKSALKNILDYIIERNK